MAQPLDETGDQTETAVEALLAGLDELPVRDHVARFDEVYDNLRARLEGTDS